MDDLRLLQDLYGFADDGWAGAAGGEEAGGLSPTPRLDWVGCYDTDTRTREVWIVVRGGGMARQGAG